MNMNILIIEDDPSTAQAIKMVLEQHDTSKKVHCDIAAVGEEGLEVSKIYDYDVIILDLMLPDIDGYEVLLRLRSSRIKIPVLILSAIGNVEDKVKGLGFGADDYLTKPFNKDELIARIQAIVRRSNGHCESIVRCDDRLCINLDTRTVSIDGKPIHLTNKEYIVLELLALRKGSVVNKEMFVNHLYGNSISSEPDGYKIIDVFICKVRQKLFKQTGKDYIVTIWGRGYILKEYERVEEDANEEMEDLEFNI